jgi:hypothetical protein
MSARIAVVGAAAVFATVTIPVSKLAPVTG